MEATEVMTSVPLIWPTSFPKTNFNISQMEVPIANGKWHCSLKHNILVWSEILSVSVEILSDSALF